MRDIPYIKEQAKTALSYNSPGAYYAAGAVLLLSACISLITSALIPQAALAIEKYQSDPGAFFTDMAIRYPRGIVISFITVIVSYGFAVYCLKLYRNQNPEFSDLGSGFSCIFKLALLQIAVGVISNAVALPFLAAAMLGVTRGMSANGVMLFSVGVLAGVVVSTYLTLGLSQLYYLLYDNPGMPVLALIRQSFRLMKGCRWQLFGLRFSFFGYYLLAAVLQMLLASAAYPVTVLASSAVSLIYYPYLHTSLAGFYQARLDVQGGVLQNSPPEDETL